MKIYHAGGDTGAFIGMGAGTLSAETTSYAVTNYSAGSIAIPGSETWLRAYMIDPTTQARANVTTGAFWLHYLLADSPYNWTQAGTSAGATSQIVKGDGTPLFRMYRNNTGSQFIRPQYWNGTVWVSMGAADLSYTKQINHQWDVSISAFAAGSTITVYLDKAQVFQATGVDTSTWNVGWVDFYSSANNTADNNGACYQQIVHADGGTLDVQLRRRGSFTAAGTNVGWVGSYANVNKFPANDTTFITSGTTSEVQTDVAPAFSALASTIEIKAVVVAARIRHDGGAAPQNAKAVLRIGTTNYAANGNFAGVTTALQGAINIFSTDPSTAAAWGSSVTDVNGEFGVQSTT